MKWVRQARETPLKRTVQLNPSSALGLFERTTEERTALRFSSSLRTLSASAVVTLYFSSIGVTKWKHSLKAGLIADAVGIAMGVILSIMFFGF